MVPTKLGIVLIHGYYYIDPELVLPTVRGNIEKECTLIAQGKARKEDVVEHSASKPMSLLQKAGSIDIKIVCPLHGPLWRKDLGYFIEKYDKWSRYEPEENGVLIVYASMYGNMESAAQRLASMLTAKGVEKIAVYDVSNTHVSHLIAETFKYSHIVLASVTYNLGIYPLMHNYLMDMKALNMQDRTVAIMEGGSWAPKAGVLMEELLDEMKQMTVLNEKVTVLSTLSESSAAEMEQMADAIVESLGI